MITKRSLLVLFLVAGLTLASAQSYTFTTLAGSSARFNAPQGVAMDGGGNIVVADSGNHTIRRINADGSVVTLAGAAGRSGAVDGSAGVARFLSPAAVAVDGGGNIFIADAGNHTIRRLSPEGVVTTLAGTAESSGSTDGAGHLARFNAPQGLAVDAQGNVFVADTGNHVIRKITANGVVTTFAGAMGAAYPAAADGAGSAARFNIPTAVACDAAGNLFVADSGNHLVRKITPNGNVTTLAGRAPELQSIIGGTTFFSGSADGTGSAARFNHPSGIAVDRNGNVFVGDRYNFTVRKVSAGGVVTTFAGTALYAGSADGTGSGKGFSGPTFGSPRMTAGGAMGLAVDSAGNVMVADTPNHAVRKITPATLVTTVAGNARSSGSADSEATARLSSPLAVAVDREGSAYVSNVSNYTISKITADGAVTTVAGIAGTRGFADGPAGSATFFSPRGLAVDSRGQIIVADAGAGLIRKIDADGRVTTFAGAPGNGSADGTGSVARFNYPTGIATDTTDNVFVADSKNHTIRHITTDGVVTTLAGAPGDPGSADGSGAAARFNGPEAVAVDHRGNVFVADTGNHVIRKIAVDGWVSTLAGAAGVRGSIDGTGAAARFNQPNGVAVDASGNVFVADALNNTIRRITPAGVVTTVAGSRTAGSRDGSGAMVQFDSPFGVAVDAAGNLFVADAGNHTLRKGVPGPPDETGGGTYARLVTVSHTPHVEANGPAWFVAISGGFPLGFQWKKNGVPIPGATTYTYEIRNATAADMGFYSVVVTSPGPTIESPVAILTVATGGTSRLSNLSTRGLVPAGGDLTVGFVIRGGTGKSLLVRGVGPTLSAFGVAGALSDPKLELVPASPRTAPSSNEDWAGNAALAGAFAATGAFPRPPASKDAALLAVLPGGSYSARITSGAAGTTGVVLAELYDRDAIAAEARLVNISTLGLAGVGAEALVPGFVIEGTASKRLLIRAIGPGLAPFGVGGTLEDPQLVIVPAGAASAVANNDNWGGAPALAAAFVSAGAFALPASSNDAALIVRLPPGGYTVVTSGPGDSTGRALVEIYDLDP